jgi:hypothetical protein
LFPADSVESAQSYNSGLAARIFQSFLSEASFAHGIQFASDICDLR